MAQWMFGTIFILAVAFVVFVSGYAFGKTAGHAGALAEEYLKLDSEEEEDTDE